MGQPTELDLFRYAVEMGRPGDTPMRNVPDQLCAIALLQRLDIMIAGLGVYLEVTHPNLKSAFTLRAVGAVCAKDSLSGMHSIDWNVWIEVKAAQG